MELRFWWNGADDGVYAGQDATKLRVVVDLGDVNLDTTVSELQCRWLAA